MKQEKKDEFVRNYVEQFKGNSYESYAEREDIANACFDAMKWAEENWIEKAVGWLEPVFKELAGYYCGGDLIKAFKKIMMED